MLHQRFLRHEYRSDQNFGHRSKLCQNQPAQPAKRHQADAYDHTFGFLIGRAIEHAGGSSDEIAHDHGRMRQARPEPLWLAKQRIQGKGQQKGHSAASNRSHWSCGGRPSRIHVWL